MGEEFAEKFKISEGSQVHERAGVGDDQGLSGLAPSLEIVNGLGVGVPVIRCVDDVRNAALLQQFHKRDAFEAELVGGLARRDSAIRKKG